MVSLYNGLLRLPLKKISRIFFFLICFAKSGYFKSFFVLWFLVSDYEFMQINYLSYKTYRSFMLIC